MEKSISSLFELYLTRSPLAESSVEIKKRALNFFIKCFGDRAVDSIRFAEAEDFKVFLAKGRSKVSANSYLQNFKPFYSWLFKRGYIVNNPFDEIKLYTVGETQRVVYSVAEIERLLTVADLRWKIMILLGLSSLRRAEILNLCVSDIHFDKGYILVSGKKDTAQTWEWEIKDHNQAITPLPEVWEMEDVSLNLHTMIIELIDRLPPGQPYVMLKPQHYQRMIERKKDGTLTWREKNQPWPNFSRSFSAVLKRAKVSEKSLHDLRATFATKMSDSLDLSKVQKLMRHSSPATTAKYYIRRDQEQLAVESNELCRKMLCV